MDLLLAGKRCDFGTSRKKTPQEKTAGSKARRESVTKDGRSAQVRHFLVSGSWLNYIKVE